MNSIRPHDLGVPHDEWRPNQFETYESVAKVHENGGGFVFAELGTGSGKSGVATALGSENNVLVLVQNLGLLEQYEKIYGFSIVKGRQEYPCVMSQKVRDWKERYGKAPTAEDCHLDSMYECAEAHRCPYMLARDRAIHANRSACTYKYAMLSDPMRNRDGIIVMDEAHLSAEEILATSSFEIDSNQIKDFNLPDFPIRDYGIGGQGDLVDNKTRMLLYAWFEVALSRVAQIDLFDRLTPLGSKMKRATTLLSKGFDIIKSCDNLFLDVSIPFSEKYKKQRGLVIKIRPLEAKGITKSLWSNKETKLLMSATIGNPQPLAEELGIDSFDTLSFPHPIPKEFRPVYDLGLGRMTKDNLDRYPNMYKVQAKMISRWINQYSSSWRGIILTTSYQKIEKLKQNLDEDIVRRIFESESKSLNERISAFKENKTPGMIAIDTIQGWGSGIDLYGDTARFSVIAGVPYPNPSDRYDQLRLARPGGLRYAWWTAYNSVPQAAGRVSRGERNSDGSYVTNVAALADGSAMTNAALHYYPKYFKEAIVR